MEGLDVVRDNKVKEWASRQVDRPEYKHAMKYRDLPVASTPISRWRHEGLDHFVYRTRPEEDLSVGHANHLLSTEDDELGNALTGTDTSVALFRSCWVDASRVGANEWDLQSMATLMGAMGELP
jgi:hypothetical protein